MKSATKPRSARLIDDSDFRSRLSSWSNKQHQDQSKAGVILWLQESFETGCKESMAKEDVYRLYVAHFKDEGTEPLRASMFGKLVHRAFPGLKSSRIGTRGATRHSYKSFRWQGIATTPRLQGSSLYQRHVAGGGQARLWEAPFKQAKHYETQSGSAASSNPSSPFSPDSIDEAVRGRQLVQNQPSYYESAHTARAGDSSPASFPSPTRPLDTFAYTSDAFSPFVGTNASASAPLSSPNRSRDDCMCDECLLLGRRVAPQGPYFYANLIGYSSRPDNDGYWATHTSSSVARQYQPPTVDDYLFRDLSISL